MKEKASRKRNLKKPIHILDDLPLKFWVQTFDCDYEDIFYTPAIKHLFPNYNKEVPMRRSMLRNIFAEMQAYRNTISHHRVVIHEEHKLINYYRKFLEVIYWMDSDYYKFVVKHSKFLRYHRITVMNLYSCRGIIWYIWRQFRRFFMTHLWEFMRKYPNIFHIEE